MKKILIVIAILSFVLMIVFLRLYNGLAVRHENIKNKWSRLETQLERRNGLIRDLVNSIKPVAPGEAVLQDITDLRLKWTNAADNIEERVRIANSMDTELERIFLIQEAFPNLKSDHTFQKLSDELTKNQDMVVFDGKKYNDGVNDYNLNMSIFPNNILANVFGFKPATKYFRAGENGSQL